jgi:hypothetical protein
MTIFLPGPSASPLHSFASLPTHRAPSVADALRAIVRWITGRQPKPPKSEVQFEQRIVDLLAQELEENEPHVETSLDETSERPELSLRDKSRTKG